MQMQVVKLSGSPREGVGKKATKAVRNQGHVPCVIYGLGEQVYFSVRSVELEKLIYNPNVHFIDIDINGTVKRAIIQDFQMHPLTDMPLHVDFLELADDKPVKIKVPLRLTGRARGVLAGGNQVTNFRKLTVFGLPKDIPAHIEVEVSSLRIGQNIRIGQVDVPGVKVLGDPQAVITAVKMARGARKDAEDDDEEEETE